MSTISIRSAEPADLDRIKAVAVESGMFTDNEVVFFDDLFDPAGRDPDTRWLVADVGGGLVQAATYYAPEPFSDRMWNLYFIAVDPKVQGQGIGAALMATVEQHLRERGSKTARVLIVETSSTDQYARTRDFYAKIGYAEEARIRQFYGPSDDKVVF